MPLCRSLISPSGRFRIESQSPLCCIAHRGARAFAPENTLPAFEKAAALGCKMIEVDVHLSGDGELVVHHDDCLTRCTDVRAKFPERVSDFVSDYDLAELRTLDAGSWYVRELALPAVQRQTFLRTLGDAEIRQHIDSEDLNHFASGLVAIPTLREILEWAGRLDMLVNVEIKALPRMYPGIAAEVVALVAELGFQQAVLISSFDHEQLIEVRRLDARIATGVLTSDRLARPAEYLRLLGADAYQPGCYGEFDSIGFGSVMGRADFHGMRQVLDAGGLVFAWTCNDRQHMRVLADGGVSGIITDYPNRFADTAAV